MKGSRQNLSIEKPQLASAIFSSHTPCFEPKEICQQQVKQLGVQLPIVAAWIVYQDYNHLERQSVVHYTHKSDHSYPDLSYLELEVGSVALPANTLSEVKKIGSLTALACLLNHYGSEPEYILLWTYEPLSINQQQWVQEQAKFLASYLVVCRECYRQQAQIQLLEQVVQRTEHQLRNPLALIGLYAANLCRGLPTGIMKEQAMVISETVKELSTILTDLLACSQKKKLRVAVHDLRSILAESLQGLKPWLEQKQLKISYPEQAFVVEIDRTQIKQVFDNLLSNAVHFSPVGGKITCHWQIFHNEVLFEICDQGIGLSEQDLKQIFTAFYTRRPGGTGLGLAITKKILLDHHGNIWAQNLPSGGAQFSFTLPRSNSVV